MRGLTNPKIEICSEVKRVVRERERGKKDGSHESTVKTTHSIITDPKHDAGNERDKEKKYSRRKKERKKSILTDLALLGIFFDFLDGKVASIERDGRYRYWLIQT
jgi:hypothetical protein